MAVIASFVTVRPEMASTRTYQDFSKFLGEKPKRIGLVSQMYSKYTASYLTEGLGNIFYMQKKGSKFQKINSLAFEWEIAIDFVKRVPFKADVTTSGANGSEIVMYFPERYYEKYDTLQVIDSKQQIAILYEPIRKADDMWEYVGKLIDETLEDSLDLDSCKEGMETRFLTNIQPELSEIGYTKYQSNIQKSRNWLTEIRHDISYSSRYARMEDTFIKIATGEGGGDYKEAIFRMPKMQQALMDEFMKSRNNSMLLGKTTMDANGKCTLFDPATNRPLISGDGAIPQINRFANMFAYSKLTVDLFNQALMALTEKAEDPQGNTFIFIANERCYQQVQVALGQHLMQYKPVNAEVYSQAEGNKLTIGAEYVAYNFIGNTIIFKIDRALSIEYPNRGYAVMIDLTADKKSGQPAIQQFTLEGAEYITNTIAGVGGLNGATSGVVSSPVAGSRYICSGYAGIGVFAPYRSAILLENK